MIRRAPGPSSARAHLPDPSEPSTSTAPPPPPVPVLQQEPVAHPGPSQERKYEFFVPPPRNQDLSQDQFFQRLPHHILQTVIDVLLREASLFSQEYTRMSTFNIFGKSVEETVDIGQEIDYAGYEWFKDPPPPTQMVRVIPYPGVWGLLTPRLSRYSDQSCRRRTIRSATWCY